MTSFARPNNVPTFLSWHRSAETQCLGPVRTFVIMYVSPRDMRDFQPQQPIESVLCSKCKT